MKTWGPAGPIFFFLKVEQCTEVSEGDVNFLHVRSAGLRLCSTCVLLLLLADLGPGTSPSQVFFSVLRVYSPVLERVEY